MRIVPDLVLLLLKYIHFKPNTCLFVINLVNNFLFIMAQDIETEKPIVREVSKIAEEKPAFADSALSFLHEVGETTFTKDEEKKLVRVVDWMILPLLAAVYFLQFLDKNLSTFRPSQILFQPSFYQKS